MAETPRPAIEKLELRRDVTVWGSHMWGYADAGIDLHRRDPGRRGYYPHWGDRVPARRQGSCARQARKRTGPPEDAVIQFNINQIEIPLSVKGGSLLSA